VVQPDRSCRVAVNTDQKFLLPSSVNNRSDGDGGLICGSRQRPWLLEAPSGQRINISLLDFTASSRSSAARTGETSVSSRSGRCVRQFGFIDDKSANRHVNICIDATHTQPTVYVSRSNTVTIVTDSATAEENEMNRFLIGFIGMICWLLIYYCLLVSKQKFLCLKHTFDTFITFFTESRLSYIAIIASTMQIVYF